LSRSFIVRAEFAEQVVDIVRSAYGCSRNLCHENKSARAKIIADIINLLDGESVDRIIKTLAGKDPKLAEEVRKRIFLFESIVVLDNSSIQRVLRAVGSQTLSKALKGAAAEVQEKIFRNMTKRAATMLMEDIEYMGPLKRQEVMAFRQKIVSMVRYLEDIGEIVIPRSSGA